MNYEVKFLTYEDAITTSSTDLNCSKYVTKKKHDETVFDAGKRKYIERRSGKSKIPRQRVVKDLESKFFDQSAVFCDWVENNIIIIFSTGLIGIITVKEGCLDIEQIHFDRYCVGKLSGHTITAAAFTNDLLLFTHVESLATLFTFGGQQVDGGPTLRLADRHPYVQTIELADGARRADRSVTWATAQSTPTKTRVLVWTRGASEPVPWTPEPEARADLHLYTISGSHINVIAYHKLENETLCAEMSRNNFNVVHIVDQVNCRKNGVLLEWSRYTIPSHEEGVIRLSSHRAGVTRVRLPAPARVVKRVRCDTKLLLACIDGSLHVVQEAGLTHSVKTGFIANSLWGEDIYCVCGVGRVRVVDAALYDIHAADCSVPLHSFTRDPTQVSVLACRSIRTGVILLTRFSEGPLALIKLTHPNLLTSRTGSKLIANVNLLHAMDWELEGDKCLYLLQKIFAEVFRSRISSQSESILQSALGAYLSLDVAPERYRAAVIALARKFYHHLLRRGRLDKAMSLAVDISAWDLFCDARRLANKMGRTSLEQEALELAKECAAEHDSNSSDSCSCSDSQSYTSSESPSTLPPPLPRIPPPSHLVHVSTHTHNDNYNTHSIRPNLHQYLERDATIWNTDVAVKHTDVAVKITDVNISKNTDVNFKPTVRWRSLDVLNEEPSNLERRNRSIEILDYNEDYRYEMVYGEKKGRQIEKNVKFSDTVTVNVVSESRPPCPLPAQELADSLPLRPPPPRPYLAAFEPAPTTTTVDVKNSEKPTKIKVVHFGMV